MNKKSLVTFGHAVFELYKRTDRQTDTDAHTDTHHNSQYSQLYHGEVKTADPDSI